MRVITTNAAGETITYAFDPEHHESVMVFYQELKERGDLVNYRVTD